MPEADGIDARGRIERLLLWHLWACVPFAIPWMILPQTFGRPHSGGEIFWMRLLYGAIGVSLAIRTWIVLKRVGGLPWTYIWPVVDVAFITAGAQIGYAQPDSWVIALYILPVLQAAATLDVRWSVTVAVLAAVCGGSVGGFENLRYSYFLFRLVFLILVASAVTRLARGLARARADLEVARYRSELASEMHDGLQQYLGAIAMRLEHAQASAARDQQAALESAVSVKTIARQASDELRLMLYRLRSPQVTGESLEAALRYQAALMGERSSVPVDVRIEGNPRSLPPKVEHELLRIAQEALNNAARHADATAVNLSLTYRADSVSLVIQDDGKGIAPDAKDGLGLETMRNRAQAMGGTLALAGEGGTTVKVEAPV